jgi:uncharacterized membrane protein YgcG
MKKTNFIFYILLVALISSCSSGKKAFQKGDYYSALYKAVDRLKSSPENKNATKVLREGYPVTMEWTQEEMDRAITSNDMLKWERAINLMEQVNRLSDQIRSTPAARKIISNPKSYTSELNMAREKAAEIRYNLGLDELDMNTRETARSAYDNFYTADRYVPGYKNVRELLMVAKEKATLKVVMEAIPVPSMRYRLSSEFFYNQVFEYLNNRFRNESFVHFYSPNQAEKEGLNYPDFVVDLEFFDFSVGNLVRSEKEENLSKRVPIESRDTTKVRYKTYSAKLKTFTDQVVSGGNLRVIILEPSTDKLLLDELIPGSFTWVNQYAMYVGDAEALNEAQFQLTRNRAVPLPPHQDLFIEFTKPIYDQLTNRLYGFFRRYN